MIAQGSVVAVWWGVLAFVPESRPFFRPAGYPDSALFAFAAADIACVIAGSLIAAWQLRRRDPRAHATIWFTTGALVYATLYCAAVTITTGEAILAMILMIPPTLITLWIAARARAR